MDMCIKTDGTENSIGGELISDNSIAQVYRNDGWIYKRSLPFLIENEIYCLKAMSDTGFVPEAERYDKYTIRMKDLGKSDYVFDREAFARNMYKLLSALQEKGIRHGDITKYAIIVKKDWPFIIDFAESRLKDDPRPDKRKEGDLYWLQRTIDELSPQI